MDSRFRQGLIAGVAGIGVVSLSVQLFGAAFTSFLILLVAFMAVYYLMAFIRVRQAQALSGIQIKQFQECLIRANENHYLFHKDVIDFTQAAGSVGESVPAADTMEDRIIAAYQGGLSKNKIIENFFTESKNKKKNLDKLNNLLMERGAQ